MEPSNIPLIPNREAWTIAEDGKFLNRIVKWARPHQLRIALQCEKCGQIMEFNENSELTCACKRRVFI